MAAACSATGQLTSPTFRKPFQFALGAMTASTVWFSTLGLAARTLAGPLGKASVWRVVDLAIGVVMLLVAVSLVA